MKIISTKQTWCIKANDVHKRFKKHLPGIDIENDADILQFAIWFTAEHGPQEIQRKLKETWRALVNHKTIEL